MTATDTAGHSLAQELAAGAELVAQGDACAALRKFARLLALHPEEPRLYHEASRALFAALGNPALAAWDADEKALCYRRLLNQQECDARPIILAHATAARLTSADTASVRALVTEMAGVLPTMAETDAISKNMVLFLLVVRESLGERIGQARISALHLAWFRQFEIDDLALPYSVMFNPQSFGRNRTDILQHVAEQGDTFLAELRPHHLPLIEWLAMCPLAGHQAKAACKADLPPAELSAIRALVLRHNFAPETRDLGRGVRELADRLAAARAQLAVPGADNAATRRLSNKGWMAARAARNLVATRLPLLARGQRRVRVAVCVSGQLRGFRRVLPTWQRHLFAHADCTLFVHSWAAIGRSGAQPFRVVLPFAGEAFQAVYRRLGLQEGFEAFQVRYPALFDALQEGATVTAEEICRFYGTPHVVIDDETAEPFAGMSNQQKMHYKIWAAHRLMEETGEPFDLVVRIRPDLGVRNAAFDWRDMARATMAGPLVFTERPYGVHYGKLMIGDQFAIGARLAMDRYADAWTLYPEVAALDVMGCPPGLTGHVSLAQTCWLHGLDLRRAPIRFGALTEPDRLKSAAILAALEADAIGRMDAIDRELIEAARTDTTRPIH